MRSDIEDWLTQHEQQLSGITEQLPYYPGQVIHDLPLFIKTQKEALSFPETSAFYKNACERLEGLRAYLKQHKNINT